MTGESGQASVEVIAVIPALLLAGLICLQLGLAGLALGLADGAAEAGALAEAGGLDGERAALEALPQWARERSDVSAEDGAVEIELRAPAVVPGLGGALTFTSSAWARTGGIP